MKMSVGGETRRRGFLIYIVLSSLLLVGILAFSISSFKRDAVEQLSRTVDQNRLLILAQGGTAEILGILRYQANLYASPMWKTFRSVFAEKDPLAGGPWKKTVDFPPGALPAINAIAGTLRGFKVKVEGRIKLVFLERSNTNPVSYSGFIEVQARASAGGNYLMEAKERREIKLVNLQDFLDKYALFVKGFVPDYNDRNRRLRVEGLASKKTYSWIYLGNRDYPQCLEFPSGELAPGANGSLPPILLDVDFVQDSQLLSGFAQGSVGFPGKAPLLDSSSTMGKMFWITQSPIKFSSLAGNFKMDDFFPVSQLREYYRVTIGEASLKAQGSTNQNSTAYPIAQDYLANRNNYPGSTAFKALIQTCMDSWEYKYGYTDYMHLFPDNKADSAMGHYPFNGVASYFTEYQDYNNWRILGGRMPAFFGEKRNTATMIEGQAYVRFFKIAYFDPFVTTMNCLGSDIQVEMPPLPLHFARKGKQDDFQNREIPKFSGNEKWLMSRAVEEFPINRFFFPKETKPRPEPEQYGSKVPGADIYPANDPLMDAFEFDTGADLVRERTVLDGSGRKILDLDGQMQVNKGDLDLSGVNLFRGRGVIVVVNGNCRIGNFQRMDPGSGDSAKIYLTHGNFEVTSAGQSVKIEASLVALALGAGAKRPYMFCCNNKDVHILGNLVVDYLPIDFNNRGIGRELLIEHDPRLFAPSDPFRVSIGQVRTMFSINAGDASW